MQKQMEQLCISYDLPLIKKVKVAKILFNWGKTILGYSITTWQFVSLNKYQLLPNNQSLIPLGCLPLPWTWGSSSQLRN